MDAHCTAECKVTPSLHSILELRAIDAGLDVVLSVANHSMLGLNGRFGAASSPWRCWLMLLATGRGGADI